MAFLISIYNLGTKKKKKKKHEELENIKPRKSYYFEEVRAT